MSHALLCNQRATAQLAVGHDAWTCSKVWKKKSFFPRRVQPWARSLERWDTSILHQELARQRHSQPDLVLGIVLLHVGG